MEIRDTSKTLLACKECGQTWSPNLLKGWKTTSRVLALSAGVQYVGKIKRNLDSAPPRCSNTRDGAKHHRRVGTPMASSPNLSVPHSQDNPAPKRSLNPRPAQRIVRCSRMFNETRFAAGTAPSASRLCHSLTRSQSVKSPSLRASGFCCSRRRSFGATENPKRGSARFASAAIESRLAAPMRNGQDGEKRR